MASYTISGTAYQPDGVTPLVGTWTITIVSSNGTAIDAGGKWRFGGEKFTTADDGTLTVTLPATVDGEYLYSASFKPTNGPLKVGPFLFDLTANTTWADIIETPSLPPVTPSLVAQAQTSATQAQGYAQQAQGAVSLTAWAPTTAVAAGAVRQLPDGTAAASTVARTTRSSFDTTEATNWTPVVAKSGTLAKTALDATYAPRWQPSTVYAAGAVVQAPDGSAVSANAAHTSGTTYTAANWTAIVAKSGTLAYTGRSTTLPDVYTKSKLAYISSAQAFVSLRKFLDAKAGHGTLQVLGDSTAGLSGNWVYDVATWAAAQDPALRVRYRGLDTNTGLYTAPTMIQGGTKGTHNVAFTDVNGSYAYITNAGNFATTLDLAVKIQPSVWPPAAQGTLVARMDASPNYGWALYAMPTGVFKLQWSVTGSSLTSVDSAVVTLGTTDYTWIRVVASLSGSDVTVTYYTSFDGYTWTQVGTPFTNVGWGPINQPANTKTSIGAWAIGNGNGSSRFVGKIGEAWVRDGSGGPTLGETQASDWAVASNATYSTGWFLDVVNGGWPSRTLNDLIVNAKTLQPHMGQTLTVLCSGHNDSSWSGVYYAGLLDSWRAAVLARSPYTALAVTAQNPRVPPAVKIDEHAARHAVLAGWANRNGAGLLDVYDLFKADPRYDGTNTSVLYNSDGLGVHPSPTGWQLWADLFTAAVQAGR